MKNIYMVQVSFELPEYTAEVDALGTIRILDIIKSLNLKSKTRFYQASTSELYGKVQEIPQSENTPFYPRSPYGVAKLYAYWIVKNYREAYDMFACNGILFNHESPRRGETFVTRKITMGLSQIIHGQQKSLILGNIYSLRDWGHAKDYVEMCWKILQHKKSDDFVIATEKQYSVKFFVEKCFQFLKIKIKWSGKGLNEIARISSFDKKKFPKLSIGQTVVRISKKYFRPNEVDNLIGNSTKAKKTFNWKPKISINELIKEMLEEDIKLAKSSSLKK